MVRRLAWAVLAVAAALALAGCSDGDGTAGVDGEVAAGPSGRVGIGMQDNFFTRDVARVEVAKNPTNPDSASSKMVWLTVRSGMVWRKPLFIAGLLALLAPLFHALARGAFESKRWSQSDHAG